MKTISIITLLLFVLQPIDTLAQRPSFRSIRDSAVQYQEQTSVHKQSFTHTSGIQLLYPKTWLSPTKEKSTLANGATMESFIFIPHDRNWEYTNRPNRILELYMRIIPSAAQNLRELDMYMHDQMSVYYNEFYVLSSKETTFKNLPAIAYRLETMTGEREEIWVQGNKALYIFGYRSLVDFYDDDHFFYEEMLDSIVLQEVIITTQTKKEPEQEQMTTLFFSDIEGTLYKEAIESLQQKGIIQGYSNGTFQPNATVNRAEFTKIVAGATNEAKDSKDSKEAEEGCIDDFSDLEKGAWYVQYVCTAKSNGLIDGYPDGTFRPANNINFAEAAKIVVHAFGIQEAKESKDSKDSKEAEEAWYTKYIDVLAAHGAIPQPEPQPGDLLTRGQMAQIIFKAIQ